MAYHRPFRPQTRVARIRLAALTAGRPGGASKGLPRFLRATAPDPDRDGPAECEARHLESAGGVATRAAEATPRGRAAAEAVAAAPAAGTTLPAASLRRWGQRLGRSFDQVRVHPRSPVAEHFGANALTYANQIHVAPGRFAPESTAGDRLLGHELAHVAQQATAGAPPAAQFDLVENGLDTGLGTFDLDLVQAFDAATLVGATGLRGTIAFTPHEFAPYANRIGLIQIVDVERVTDSGRQDFVWGGSEANRENVKTPSGAFVDMLHGEQSPTRESEPWYWEGMSGDPDDVTQGNVFGWNRGEGDLHETRLWDWPRSTTHVAFDFETVAVGRDTATVYGSLRWGFEVSGSNLLSNEWHDNPVILQSGTGEAYQSPTFEAARQRFRAFYIHEPQIVYFDTNADVPQGGELDKLQSGADYLLTHPDVDVELTAYADTRGSARYNRALALRRMNAVQTHLLSLGVDPARIHRNEAASGETATHGAEGAGASRAGSLLANRRVVVRYQRMMSLP
ncbi:MAG: DUF4157 domain-containing protein [Geminicoccaceae bacterium]|nr:MAG: DUF4157 domain-containing protein [Geminicoccaceae bacterium]